MSTTTIRVKGETRDRFAEISRITGRSMTELLDDAATALERELFFTQLETRFSELRDDPEEWRDILRERTIESPSLRDSSE